jgi:predicted nucleic acid-binding protein
MSATDAFFDTNVLLYLLSGNSDKADRAEELLANGGVISAQVLNEFAAVASRKLGKAWPDIRNILDVFCAVCVVEPVSLATHSRALEIAERHGYSIYDSNIIAAALIADCKVLFSEDMHHGHVVERRLVIRNPFKS